MCTLAPGESRTITVAYQTRMYPMDIGLTLVSTTCGAKLLQSVESLLAPGEQFGLRGNGDGDSGHG